MSYEPTLTATDSPSPRVRVDFDSLDPETATVTVYRSYGDEVTTVRDAVEKFAVGGFTVTDYEVPLGITVWYAAEMFDADGISLGVTGNSDTVIYVDEGYAWFSNPLDPTDAVYVPLRSDFGVKKGRSRPSERYQVGTSVVALLGQQGLIQEFNASCITLSIEDADQMRRILDAGLVLVRTSPRLRHPAQLYLVIDEYVETGNGSLDDVEFGGERIEWPLSGYEVTVPSLSAGVFEGTWQDVIDNFATWDDLIAAYPTWLDLLKNPPGV